jgi:hypothetical protein
MSSKISENRNIKDLGNLEELNLRFEDVEMTDEEKRRSILGEEILHATH